MTLLSRLHRLLAPALAAGLLAGSLLATPLANASGPVVVPIDPNAKIHPLLQYGAVADPTRLVRVVVQKTRNDVSSSLLTVLVPGLLLGEDYKNIPAFTATLPQAAVGLLALNPNVRYISPDSAVQVLPAVAATLSKPAPKPPAPKPVPAPKSGFDPSNLLTVFPFVSGATRAWTGAATPDGHYDSGQNISVAVIDSGVDANHPDIAGQVLAVNVNRSASNASDGYGHGTHVAAIINGHDDNGQFYGVAPSVTVISVKIADDNGVAYESDLLRGLDWVRTNRDAYHIRAVNLSVSSGVAASYVVSPVDAAVERLWNDNVAVVAAAGNLGTSDDAVWYAPANDPYAITVGCLDDNATASSSTDDSLCPISSRGITEDGFAKPDIVAAGRKVVSALSSGINGQGSVIAAEFPDRITPDGAHIRLSGTSMAAPSVTGAIALLLQRHGGLTPNQLRQLLIQTASTYPGQPDGAGALNIPAALVASDHAPDTHYTPIPVGAPVPPTGTSTVLWDGSRWASAFWDGSRWANAVWNGSRWASAEWDGSRWANTQYDGSRWAASHFDGSRWASAEWDGSRWANAYWDGSRWSGSAWDSDASLD